MPFAVGTFKRPCRSLRRSEPFICRKTCGSAYIPQRLWWGRVGAETALGFGSPGNRSCNVSLQPIAEFIRGWGLSTASVHDLSCSPEHGVGDLTNFGTVQSVSAE